MFHRVYYQGRDNYIYELSYNDSAGWDLNARKLFEALPGTQMAALTFARNKADPDIRLYYFKPNGELNEYAYSGGKWGPGAKIPAPDCATNSRLSSVVWGDGPDIRVYYQTWDNILAESAYIAGGWKAGKRFD